MKKILLLSVALVLVVGVLAIGSQAGASNRFRADLRGENEVPPTDSLADGTAKFEFSGDGSMLTFKFKVSDVMDFTQSHIHIAPEGVNGPIAVWLVPARPPLTLIRGEVQFEVNGTITAADLVGPLAGMTLAELKAQMEAGNAYVNVHTVAHPPGEIRGQIMAK